MKVLAGLLVVSVTALALWFAYWFPHRSPGARVVSSAGGFSLCMPNSWSPKEQPDGSITAESPPEAPGKGGVTAGAGGVRLLAFTVPDLQRTKLQELHLALARLRARQGKADLSLAQLPDPRLAVFLAMELQPADPSSWHTWPAEGRPESGLHAEGLRLFESVPLAVPAASGRLVIFQQRTPSGIEAHLVAVMEKSDRLTVVDFRMPREALERHRPMLGRILRTFRWFH